MQKFIFKKFVAGVLVASMIFTTGGFVTLADSISDATLENKSDSESKEDISHKYYDELMSESVSESDEIVGASDDSVGARPSAYEASLTSGVRQSPLGGKLGEPAYDLVAANDDSVSGQTKKIRSSSSEIEDEIEYELEDEEVFGDYEEEPEVDEETQYAEEPESDETISNDTDKESDDVELDSPSNLNEEELAEEKLTEVESNTKSLNEEGTNDIKEVTDDEVATNEESYKDEEIINEELNNDENVTIEETTSTLSEASFNDENVEKDGEIATISEIDLSNDTISTLSEIINEEKDLELNISSISEIDINEVNVDFETATISDATYDVASDSEIDIVNFSNISLASDSEINLASDSNIEIASISEIEIASLSELKVASTSELFGAGITLPSTIWFGAYLQGYKNLGTYSQWYEPIKWKVLWQDGNVALLLSDTILVGGVSNVDGESWEDSNIRQYLNETFINEAFTETQINGILETNITTDGDVTSDKIFILSQGELNTYNLKEESSRRAVISNKAKYAVGASNEITTDSDNCASWWVRDRFVPKQRIINSSGELTDALVESEDVGIRPAMLVDLNSGLFRATNNHVTYELNGAEWHAEAKIWPQFDAYQGGQSIYPPDGNGYGINIPYGKKRLGWVIQGTREIITEIPADQTGDIVLELKLGTWYNLSYDLDGGSFNIADSAIPHVYASGVGVEKLTTFVIGQKGKVFDHWELNGVPVTGISETVTGDITVKAVYVDLPEYVWYGTYPQGDSSGTQVEPIKWKILKVDDGMALLFADKVLDFKEHGHYMWDQNETIRGWLNGEFKNKAFTDFQSRKGIKMITLKTWLFDFASWYGEMPTPDDIFILQYDELKNYVSSEYIKTSNTNYAANKGSSGKREYYWLRGSTTLTMNIYDNVTTYGPFGAQDSPVRISYWPFVNMETGKVEPNRSNSVDYFHIRHDMYPGPYGIRPAMNISLSSSIFRAENNSVTWDLNGGSWKSGSTLWGEYDKYQLGQKLPDATNINPPSGKEFVGFKIDGTRKIIKEIPTDQKGNIKLVAIYSNPYNITWDLTDGATSNTGSWDGEPGPTTYQQGLGMEELPTNVIGPTGRAFDHWEINGTTVTSINDTDSGNKIIKAVYRNAKYDIHWSLGGGSFENNWTAPTLYEYGVGLNLTEATNKYVAPTDKRFIRWLLQFEGETTTTSATEISATASKKVTIIAECSNSLYSIRYVDENGDPITWNGEAGPIEYEYGTGITYIPTNVNPPEHKEFDHWEIGGVRVESIGSTETGDKEVVAKFKNKEYKINWDLNYNLLTFYGYINVLGDWDGEEGKDTYTYGTPYTLPTNIEAPVGFNFVKWQLNDGTNLTDITEISSSDYGDKTIEAVFDSNLYHIYWNLNGATINGASSILIGQTEYHYADLISDYWMLPPESEITMPAGKLFSHWSINGVPSTTIPQGSVGDLTITLISTDIPSHNIAWDYGTGENHWSFTNGYVAPATYSEGTEVIFPHKSFVSVPNGREFDYFTVRMGELSEPVQSTEIASTSTTDVIVGAVLKNKTYRIKYNLGSGSWDGTAGATSYTHGTPYTLPTNITAPRGQEFDHWEIGGVQVATISATDYGHKEVTVIYRNKTYSITWDLKGATIPYASPSYTYGEEIILPVASDITETNGRQFAYWTVNGAVMTSIPATYIGDVTVVLNYATYNIKWKLGIGRFNNYTPPTFYYGGVRMILPDRSKITPRTDYAFDYWKVNGVKAAEIIAGTVGDVVVEAVYRSTIVEATDSEAKYVISISVKTKPTKTIYQKGDKFDPTGLVITVSYTDNTEVDVEYNDTTKYDITLGPDKDEELSSNETTVIVIYENAATTFDITVEGESDPDPTPYPTPTPTPYYPSSGGGGRSGGGGNIGVGPNIEPTNYIGLTKTINATVDTSQVSWVYDLVNDKFKMNINIAGETIPATNGCYIINRVVEQNVNGVLTQTIVNNTYYFDTQGNMMTGWIHTADNKWYYTRSEKDAHEGQMVFGWYKVQGKWYYFAPDGSMLSNATTPDGYNVGIDGAWIQ